jgi:hypothetical protein
MEDDFKLEFSFKGKEKIFPARLVHMGYIYKIQVDLDDRQVYFERDEERNWRVLADPEEKGVKEPDRELLGAIAEKIEEILK